MLKIIYNVADEALARRIEADLQQEGEAGAGNSVVVVVSAQANADPAVTRDIGAVLDANRRVVPVLVQDVPLPKLIEHLPAVDFRAGYNLEALRERLQASDALHLRQLTPKVIASNRRAGMVVTLVALVMFVVGLYLVGVLGVQAPTEEYDQVETEIILTRNYFVEQALPRSTEDAANFQATVDAARPTLRPVLVATATAVAGE